MFVRIKETVAEKLRGLCAGLSPEKRMLTVIVLAVLFALGNFFLIESVKKLFHLLHPFIRECIGRNDIRNVQRGYLNDVPLYIFPPDVIDGAENQIENE